MAEPKNQWKMLSKMIAVISNEFNGHLDKGGKPYILHCLSVMNDKDHIDQNDPELMQIAVGHDLIEDIDSWSLQRLRDEGFSERVITGIDLVSFRKGDIYMDRIKMIANNEDSRFVKMADLTHNSLIFRMKSFRKKDHDRIEKYFLAYAYLKN